MGLLEDDEIKCQNIDLQDKNGGLVYTFSLSPAALGPLNVSCGKEKLVEMEN